MASEKEKVTSPEAKLGLQVEDLWDIQEPQLTPTQKLNACFESIPVSAFPPAPPSQVIEIRSDASLADAVRLLSKHRVLSAPVVDVNAPKDASWMYRYMGIVEFAGIAVWILHQSELMEGETPDDIPTDPSKSMYIDATTASLSSGISSPRFKSRHPDSPTTIAGNFFNTFTSSDIYMNTKVEDISGSFRWAPFLALQKDNSFLTMLLLLSKYRMKSIPLVDIGEADIKNVITQSAVIHMLRECTGLHWFEVFGSKKLSELGLPLTKCSHVVKIHEDEPVLQAFKLMRQRGVGALPMVTSYGNKAIGNISIRDVQYLVIAPEIYNEFRSITAKDFLAAVSRYKNKQGEAEQSSPKSMITCRKEDKLKDVIEKLDRAKIHRIYTVDHGGNLEGVVTLRDIISKLVHEPPGYFGDFFDGVLPMPANRI